MADPKLEELLILGGELLQKDKVREALSCLQRALDLSPNHEKVLEFIGLTYFRLADFDSASATYQQLVEGNPQNASYRLNLGLVHLKLDKPVEAIIELSKARDLDPSLTKSLSYLGLAHARNGEYAKAYEEFLRAEQHALASEMEQHLSDSEQQSIHAQIKKVDLESQSTQNFESPNMFQADSLSTQDFDSSEMFSAVGEEPIPEPSNVIVKDLAAAGDGVPNAAPGAITAAVAVARPSGRNTQSSPTGHQEPLTVSALATKRLLRPSEGGQTLEIGAGGVLIARVNESLFSRTQGVMVSSGELGFEPATRRIRGKQTEEVFGTGDARLFVVSGEGYLLASANGEVFTALRLDDDIVYVRDEYVFAFEPCLRWENGRIPGSEFGVTQFRGEGCVAIRTPNPLLSVKLNADRVVYVESEVLAGWMGRVVPSLVKPAAGGSASTAFVECSGEGVILLHDINGDAS